MSLIISGKIIHGDHFGKVLGFPTANLDRREFVRKKMKIRLGIWSGVAEVRVKRLEVRSYKAAIVIGPIDKNRLPKIEAHLLNFKGNLYGKKIAIKLQKYLRPFKNFANTEALKKQIGIDLKRIRELEK